MALQIIKHGLMDTIQDGGRYGYQHWGVNPGGVMDAVAMQVANMLVGNTPEEAVLEMHFPGPEIVFRSAALVSLSGAEFGAVINEQPFPTNHPAWVNEGDVLRFTGYHYGTRVYLAVRGGFSISPWLNSYSTNITAAAGGYNGRALRAADILSFRQTQVKQHNTRILPWHADVSELYHTAPMHFIPGAEYGWLDEMSREQLHNACFLLSRQSDRMGYRLQGAALTGTTDKQLISTAVTRGTMQLLPVGQLIVLMADHQTTGGYPRIGHLITADMPSFSQTPPGREIRFAQTTLTDAEKMHQHQQMHLRLLQNACTLRLQDFL